MKRSVWLWAVLVSARVSAQTGVPTQPAAQTHTAAQTQRGPSAAQTRPAAHNALPVKETAPLTWVDPYIGAGGHGHVFVGASVPFGAVQVGPMNINKGWDWCSGYHYSDSVVKGFAQNHLNGTGIADLGDILIMPFTGPVRTEPGTQENPTSGYASHYDHQGETARPAYYAVWLKEHHAKVELTATERVAFHRYTFPKDRPAHIIIDLFQGNFAAGSKHPRVKAHLSKLNDSTLIGWRNSSQWAKDRRIWFAIRTSFPLTNFTLLNGNTPIKEWSLEADTVKGLISFAKEPGAVLLKIGVSNISGENALANITAEIPDWNFEGVVRQGNEKWTKALHKIEIEAADSLQREVFYTALYHSMIAPALYNDHDSSYRGADGKVTLHAPYNNYTIFSLWDTYRTLNPLMTVIHPERVNDIVNTMLAIYVQQGKLPIWHLQGRETDCMVGYSAVPIIADAIMEGFHGFDLNLALEAMKASSTRDDYGMNYLKAEGFIPADKEKESVSKALEYAIDDWCIAQVAAKMGRTEDQQYYSKRGEYFTRYFDPATKFMRPVLADGYYREPFNPFQSIHEWGDYTEGNAWQYTWLVPQDVERLISLMGGDKPFVTKLDSLFVVSQSMGAEASPDISGLIGMYAQGNEPNHHIAYLYNFAGYPWKTAEKIKRIADEFYTAKNDGLCGNDDAGQMSAWYVMSALGIYPVNPANGIFVFGAPLVRKAVLDIGSGKRFTIGTQNFGKKNIYIQKATLDGKPYTKSFIDYRTIEAGSTLVFYMGDKPNYQFGADPEDRPHSSFPATSAKSAQPSLHGPSASTAPSSTPVAAPSVYAPTPINPTLYINQYGFFSEGPKTAVLGVDNEFARISFNLIDAATCKTAFADQTGPPQRIDDWFPSQFFYRLDFSVSTPPGQYYLEVHLPHSTIRSPNFLIGDSAWSRPLISAILHYFNKQRAKTPAELSADSHLRLFGSDRTVDLHGGWCDASGDVSKYFSHLAYANFMSPQQIPLVTWSLINTGDVLHKSLQKWGLADSLTGEALWGADYLMRSLSDSGYFYMIVFSYFNKDPEARRVVGLHANSVTTNEYQCAFREGGGMAIAALARISRWRTHGEYTSQQYLDAARRAYAHLVVNNTKYDDDGKENIIDDYCALMAATELWIATGDDYYRDQARLRAGKLNARMTPAGYFISDDGKRPFWHAADAGLPVTALIRYLDKEQDLKYRKAATATVKSALGYNVDITNKVANPFGYARQTFLIKDSVKEGFFIPHDNETGWWWQGENARLASLATAAVLGSRLLYSDSSFRRMASFAESAGHRNAQYLDQWRIGIFAREFASDQLSWILGGNPYSTCFMYGFGNKNVPYMHSNFGHGSEYGGISNGITGKEGHGDGSGIDFRTEAEGNEWRWTEQWLPHAAWFLQAITAMSAGPVSP